MAAEDAEKAESAARSATVLVGRDPAGLRPRQILTRQAFENAIAVTMALGGSTNAVLHLLAIAHTAGVPLSLDDFETIPGTRPGAVRSEAIRAVRSGRPPPGRRRAPGHENPACARACCTGML